MRFTARSSPFSHFCLLILSCFCLSDPIWATEPTKGQYDLLFKENFESGADLWEPTDSTAWVLDEVDGQHVFSLIKKKSDYEPPVRSPYNRAILKGVQVSDLELTVRLKSTSPDYNHRSLCLFFGYQDESHFYYVHFGKKADPHANQIFIVNGEPRTKISLTTTPGTDWDDNWHTARVVRKADSGEIAIFFDDLEKPVMTAKDETFKFGRVGIGSFDDPGQFDDIEVRGVKHE
ncbi:MAG: hypothetical protein KDA78_07155 [Planctomycetaceae bacterium]|nr:hypothetical protein [Planctomycetaceae bacterium]